jgi:hypothetical protein
MSSDKIYTMKDIFLSRPSWVGPEFKDGLEAFTNILKSYGINPRTLGVTDYPVNTPLDEVISIMDQCVGTIILGYPQIEVKEGVLKGEPIDSSVILATEWNHIEAGLAYAKGLPLLVIHHKGVQRGIFDKGAISKFLHEVDLSNSTWFSKEPIIGAISAWRERLNKTSPAECPKSPQQDDLQFERRSGTFISKTSNLRYCQKCYHSTPSKKVELQESQSGWHCSVCDSSFSNSDRNPPPSNPRSPMSM